MSFDASITSTNVKDVYFYFLDLCNENSTDCNQFNQSTEQMELKHNEEISVKTTDTSNCHMQGLIEDVHSSNSNSEEMFYFNGGHEATEGNESVLETVLYINEATVSDRKLTLVKPVNFSDKCEEPDEYHDPEPIDDSNRNIRNKVNIVELDKNSSRAILNDSYCDVETQTEKEGSETDNVEMMSEVSQSTCIHDPINPLKKVAHSDSTNPVLQVSDVNVNKDENGRYACFLCTKKVLDLVTHIKLMHTGIPEYNLYVKRVRKMLKLKNKQNSEPVSKANKVLSNDTSQSIAVDTANDNTEYVVGNNTPSDGHSIANDNCSICGFQNACCQCKINFDEKCIPHETEDEKYCHNKMNVKKCKNSHFERMWKKPYNCDYCARKLKNVFGMHRHVLLHHKDLTNYHSILEKLKSLQTTKCTLCSTELNWRSLKQHMSMVHGNKDGIKCEDCGIFLKNPVSLKAHRKNVHEKKERTFSCSKCEASFFTKSLLSYHLRNVHANPDVKYSCTECSYSSSSKKYLQNHYAQTHVPAKYLCVTCGRTFKTPDKLSRHNMVCCSLM